MEFFNAGVLNFFDKIGTLAILGAVAVAVITDKLVWHTRYKKALADKDRWEGIALDALRGSAATAVQTAETAVAVVSNIPDPQGDRDRARSEGAGNK